MALDTRGKMVEPTTTTPLSSSNEKSPSGVVVVDENVEEDIGGLTRKQTSFVRGFGGMLAGLTSTIILQPFDVVKVRMQVSGAYSQSTHNYKSSFHALQSLIKNEGLTALYKGSAPNILGNALAWGTYMLGYDFIKTLLAKEGESLHPAQHLFAGVAAGNVALFAVNPVWVVKTRMILQTKHDAVQYTSMRHALSTIWKSEGIRGFYKGVLPGILGTTHGGIQFMVYEALKKKFQVDPSQTQLKTVEYLVAATVSKWCAGFATYPYQVVRSQEQMVGNTVSARGILLNIFRENGVTGFYKGVWPYMVRTVPATCIIFVAYENISQYLERELGRKRT
eukprot:m.137723 g.137723  ORF g.137723 m.137723 type:complete len:336 (+) comp12231_c0_seq1:179-1186(+)